MSSSTPLGLLPTCMAVPVFVAEDVAVGRCVFQNFIHEQFEEEGVPEEILEEAEEEELEEQIASHSVAASSRYGDENVTTAMKQTGLDTNALIRQIGDSLRQITNDFSKSQERKRIKAEADKVNVAEITETGFFILCEQVFKDGISKEAIVAVFCFFADLLKKSAKSGMKAIGIRLFKWALQYVLDRVCSWVAKNGGWEKAIKSTFSVNQILAMGAGATVVVAVGGFLLYKISS